MGSRAILDGKEKNYLCWILNPSCPALSVYFNDSYILPLRKDFSRIPWIFEKKKLLYGRKISTNIKVNLFIMICQLNSTYIEINVNCYFI
jgi:hypothetical protein